MIRRIDDNFAVAPQISPADVTELARAGFTTIINNRPDDEESDQPAGEGIRAVAETLGLAYHEIPVTQAGFSHAQLDAMTSAMGGATGPVLAFCRSGTRSCNLWALAMAKGGADPDDLSVKARAAGYDLGAIRPMLNALSGGT